MPRHLPLAALLMAGAGGTHLAVAVPHFSNNALYGMLFVGADWLQLLLAAALLVSARAGVARIAMVVNALAVAAWGVSRTVGLPLAASEPVGMADAVMVMLELGAIGVLAFRAWGVAFGSRCARVSVVSLAAVSALAVGGSTVAIAGLASAGHHAEAAEPSGAHDGTEQSHAGENPHDGGWQSRNAAMATDAVHVRPDGSVHVHEAGKAHAHRWHRPRPPGWAAQPAGWCQRPQWQQAPRPRGGRAPLEELEGERFGRGSENGRPHSYDHPATGTRLRAPGYGHHPLTRPGQAGILTE